VSLHGSKVGPSDPVECGRRIECGVHRLFALVSMSSARPVFRLVKGQTGQDAERHGFPGVDGHALHRVGDGAGNHHVVRRFAANDASQSDDRTHVAGSRGGVTEDGQFKGAGGVDDADMRRVASPLRVCTARSFEQPFRNGRVVAGDDDGHPDSGGIGHARLFGTGCIGRGGVAHGGGHGSPDAAQGEPPVPSVAVPRFLLRILTAIQLTRLTIAFGAVSDIWFILLLARSGTGMDGGQVLEGSFGLAMVAGFLIAVGLYGYAASLNDVLDVRQDATFSPERPIPAGRIGIGQAVVVAISALIVAVSGAVFLGVWPVAVTMFTAAAILFFNTTGRFIPSVGIMTLGLVHAAHMFIPTGALVFTLPVWLVMTHTMVIQVAVHVHEGKRPKLTRRTAAALLAGWIFWSVLLLSVPFVRDGGGGWPIAPGSFGIGWPILAMAGFVAVALWKVRGTPGRRAGEKLRRYGAMWQSLYGAAWLMAVGLEREALWIGLFALAGFLTMTLVKEMAWHGDRVLTYRM